jgi:hypothetical protein
LVLQCGGDKPDSVVDGMSIDVPLATGLDKRSGIDAERMSLVAAASLTALLAAGREGGSGTDSDGPSSVIDVPVPVPMVLQ